jgi:CRISPR-associated protein Csm1
LQFDSYAGLRMPKKDGRILTYHDYAGQNVAKRLGVLKGDVDNLGRMFVSGLTRPGETRGVRMLRGNALSTQMHHFFSTCIDALCRSDGYADHVMVVYSGGDDIFCVGSWDRLVKFGRELRENLRRYAFDSPTVSISMGCALTGEKFPIHRGANLAEEALGESKERDGKNSMCLFDRPVGWDDFLAVERVKKRLYRAVEDEEDGLPRSVLHQLFMLHRAFEQGREEGPVENRVNANRYRWLAAYQLTRMAKSHGAHAELLEEDLLPAITGRTEKTVGEVEFSEPFIHLLPLVVRWTELLTKQE